MKYASFLVLALLVGCGTNPNRPPPAAVQVLPNDCGNRAAIENWLQQQSQVPRRSFESEQSYEYDRSQIRQRIWVLRYSCQPV